MLNRKLRKIAAAYVALQAAIWAKSAAFFFLYGFGRVADFNRQFFPGNAIMFDFAFHEAMHVAIGVLALLFGKNLAKIEWAKLLGIVFAAVALHNLAYWFTASHPSPAFTVFDFAIDSSLLLAFILVGYAVKKFWIERAKGTQQKI